MLLAQELQNNKHCIIDFPTSAHQEIIKLKLLKKNFSKKKKRQLAY